MNEITQALPSITLAAVGLPAVLLAVGGAAAALMWSEVRDGRMALARRRAAAEHARAVRRIRATATLHTFERGFTEALSTRRTPKAITGTKEDR